MDAYTEFLSKKELIHRPSGFEPVLEINKKFYPFQKDIVIWALRKGKACLFEDCGLGKTPQQLEWARHVHHHTKKPVLILAPLAVTEQTKREGIKFNTQVNICIDNKDVINGINITNYEKLHKFNTSVFGGIVLDESSILKNMNGVKRNQIIDLFKTTPYKLACTATPSPNDYMELGNHSEFLGIMSHREMLSMFFVNDSGNTEKWRLKKHAEAQKFWKWLCSWAIMISDPSDLGYSSKGFDLPELKYIENIVQASTKSNIGFFVMEANTMDERRKVRKESIQQRCTKAAELINSTDDQWIVWCGLNEESRILRGVIEESQEISGSTPEELRLQRINDFTTGKLKRLITKPSIAGFGMNWQHCNNMAFVGLSDSWEQLYQATRRIWRYGQLKPVNAHIIIEEREGKVLKNIKRKDKQAIEMIKNMVNNTKDITLSELQTKDQTINQNKINLNLPKWI